MTGVQTCALPIYIKGKDIYLKASFGNIGNQNDLRVDLPANIATLSDNDLMLLATAEPQDVTYYDAANNVIDRNNNSTTVAYIKIRQREDVNVEATGRIDAEASGTMYLGSKEEFNLGIIKGTETRIKSGKGIYGLTDGVANITCNDLLLEAATGPIGTINAPMAITMVNAGSHGIIARANGDIYLKGLAGSGQAEIGRAHV